MLHATIDYNKVRTILDKYGEETVKEMVSILNSKGALHLQNEIRKEVYEDLTYIQLTISMPSYAYFADAGRGPGKMPPIAPIKKWCIDKGISPVSAYPIAKNIGKYGTKHSAKHFLKVFYENYPQFKEQLIQEVKQSVIESIYHLNYSK